MNLTKTILKIYPRQCWWPESAVVTTGPPGPSKNLSGCLGRLKQLSSYICLLTALGTEPTSLQITALVKCIQIITTQRPSQLLLLKHFLNLHVTRKHLFEGWASHKFRSTWIYRKVAKLLSQLALFLLSLQEGVFEGLIVRILLSQKNFQLLLGYFSSWIFSFISSFISWDDFYLVLIFIHILTDFNFLSNNECES